MPHRIPTRKSNRIATRNAMTNPTHLDNTNNTTDNLTNRTMTHPNTDDNENNQANTSTNHNGSNVSTSASVLNQTVVPLMSLQFPTTGNQMSSSPETVTTPNYSSLTAQGIRDAYARAASQDPQQLPTLRETINPDMPVTADGLSLRDYVGASIGAAEANIMRHLTENLAAMLPNMIRESLERSPPGANNWHNTSHNNYPQERTSTQQLPQRRLSPEPPSQTQQQLPNHTRNTYRPDHHAFQPHHRPAPLENPRLFPPGPTDNFNNSPHQLQKWGIRFDPALKNLSIEEFVFRAESLRIDNLCPIDAFMRGFHHLLAGAANDWIWDFRHKNPYSEWSQLKYQLIKKFRSFESDFEIQRRIVERRQGQSESADAYITEIIKLKNQMRSPISEHELVRTVKENLKDGLFQLVFPMEIHSIEELSEVCKRAERNVAKRNYGRQHYNGTRRVNELDHAGCATEDFENEHQLEALKLNAQPARQLVCWNCRKPGHSFIDCNLEQRNLFCYKCGFEGVTSPNCLRCLGNPQKNMMTGPSCSHQKMTQQNTTNTQHGNL